MISENKSREELLEELEDLQKKYRSLEDSYNLKTNYIRQTENDLLSSEQRYRTLIELASEGILLGTKDGYIIEANKQLMAILGLSENELVGKHISQLPFKEESVSKYPWRFDLIHKGETVISQRTFLRPDSKEIIVEIHTRMMPDGTIQSLYIDITERQLALEKLRQSEDLFRKIFFTIPDAMSINRFEDGMFISINDGFCDFSKYSKEEIEGKTSVEINIWYDLSERKRFLDILANKGFIKNFETLFRNKTGDIRIGSISGALIELDGILHTIIITRDITEHKNNEALLKEKNEKIEAQNQDYILVNEKLIKINEELVASKERAEESDKLKTAFLQNMSHEIRTPMNAIIGFSELMSQNLDDWSKIESYSKMIINRSNDLLEIIEDILDISKIESGQLSLHYEDCNIADFFNELYIYFIEYRKRLFKETIKLKMHFSKGCEIRNIIVDKIKLKQIFVNLISNAFKFTQRGTVVFGCKMIKGELVFYVSDTGIGIEKSNQDLIFERFFQLEQKQKYFVGGTGLGLPIVKGLVNLMNGKIWLKSEINKGTTFFFTIPYRNGSIKPDINLKIKKHINADFSNKSILIVEDDYYNRVYLFDVLQPTGIKLCFAETAKQAIDNVKSTDFDIVLMDLRLPDMSGNDLAGILLGIRADLKIIAHSAYAMKDESTVSRESGCIDFLSKPIKKDLLIYTLEKHLNGVKTI